MESQLHEVECLVYCDYCHLYTAGIFGLQRDRQYLIIFNKPTAECTHG
jgi:hypothetical protein